MRIQVLPDQVASAIAAGEVIERPASVVKELVENALDAGARRIDVRIEAGGRQLIEVADDGHGIESEDLELALARHATSKLSSAEGLFSIRTLGFRGEALASIAAVARLELRSRTPGAEAGRKLSAEGGKRGPASSTGMARGTVVQVRDLFFNVPARRKFLKTETTERRHISDWMSHYAVAYPSVRFSLTQEGRSQLQTAGGGDARAALAAVLGVEIARSMIELPPPPADAEIKVGGYISPPAVDRSNRREITLFVNGRWILDPSLATAVIQAYHGLLMVGRYPMAILFLELPPDSVDVNVHPAKAEVRFRDPGMVFSIVQRSVRASLLHQAPPAIEIASAWSGPAREGWPDEAAGLLGHLSGSPARLPGLVPAARPAGSVPLLRAVGQVGTAYLVAEGPDGLYLIDQHAAHERVLFEQMMGGFREGRLESQALLEPATVEFGEAQAKLLEDKLEALNKLGFDVESFGARTFRVRAVPALLTGLAPDTALRTVVDEFEEDETPLGGELEAQLAARVCKRAAVKAGQVLSLAEQAELLRSLEACASPRTCPHGRPTLIHLSVDSLEKQFGRRG